MVGFGWFFSQIHRHHHLLPGARGLGVFCGLGPQHHPAPDPPESELHHSSVSRGPFQFEQSSSGARVGEPLPGEGGASFCQ